MTKSKSGRSSLQGLVKPAQSHDHASEHVRGDVSAHLSDEDVPTISPDPDPAAPAPRAARMPRGAKVKPAEPELKDYAHRSLYAKPETLELIRRIAFEEHTSAQALYREGLFLMLRKRGYYRDKTLHDV